MCLLTSLYTIKERQKLNNDLRPTSRQVVPIPGDGNCLFRCLALALHNSQAFHPVVRESVVEYMELHRGEFEDFPDTEQNWETFIVNTRQLNTFAGEPCILAAAKRFGLTILVHSPGLPILRYVGGLGQIIELAYLNRCHYELIQPVSQDQDHLQEAYRTRDSDCSYSLERLSQRTITELVAINEQKSGKTEEAISFPGLLKHQLQSNQSAVDWLREAGVLKTTMMCKGCNCICVFVPPYQSHPLGLFRCPTCRKCWTPASGTILEDSKLSSATFMTVAVGWLLRHSNKEQKASTSLSNRTISSLNLRLNAFAEVCLRENKEKIGGLMRIVEIDEALLHRRKYNRGRLKDSGWVLGGVERPVSPGDSPRAFLEVCPDRKRETLEQCILEHVQPGTIIVTDQFKSYNHLSRLGYYHYSVNHSKHFVDPITRAHTQRIEGFWKQVRKEAIPSTGIPIYYLRSYLASFLYRRKIGGNLKRFLEDLKKTKVEDVRETLKSYEKDALLFKEQSATTSVNSVTPELQPKQEEPQLIADTNDDQGTQEGVIRTEWKYNQRKEQRLQIYGSAPDALPLTLLRSTQRIHIKRQTRSLVVNRYSDHPQTVTVVSGSSQNPITINNSSSEESSAEIARPSYMVSIGATPTSLTIHRVTGRKN